MNPQMWRFRPEFCPLLLLASACSLPAGEYFGDVPKNPDPRHFRFCNSGEPQFLDPGLVTSTTGLKLVYAMFDGLTDHDAQGLPIPSIATHWEISEDQRRFVFHLRDDALWSNGRAITSDDFAFHITRILHPLTGSNNTEPHWKLRNGQQYTANRVRLLTADVGGFRKGQIVEIVGPESDPKASKELRRQVSKQLAYTNTRSSKTTLSLRDLPGFPGSDSKPYATIPADTDVTIIALGGPNEQWAYVHWFEGQGIYGWVPRDQLSIHHHAEFSYEVREIPRAHVPGLALSKEDLKTDETAPRRTGQVTARDLLMVPAVLGIHTPDPHTLVLETWGPVPYMIDQTPTRHYRPVPREAVSRRPQRWTMPEHIVTSGAFRLTEWHVRDYIRMVKSPTFWDRDSVRLETITAFSMDNTGASTNYYFHGGCDAIATNNVPASYLAVLAGSKRGGRPYKDYASASYLGIYNYLINTKRFPNVHYRRALSFAIDRSQFPKALNGGEIPTAQWVPGTPISKLNEADRRLCGVSADAPGVATVVRSGELCYVPPRGPDFDPEQAKREWAIAKRELGSKFRTSFSLKYNSGKDGHKIVAENIQEQWRQVLGIHVELEVQEWKTFLSDTKRGEYDVARMGWIGNYPDPESQFVNLYKCDSPNNRPQYCNQEFERLFALAESTSDRKERLRIIAQAERVMIDEAPIIPLYVYSQHHLRKPYVKGMAINLPDQVPLRRVWLDPDWRKAEEP